MKYYKYTSFWFDGSRIKGKESSVHYYIKRENAVAAARKDLEYAKQLIFDLYGSNFFQDFDKSGIYGVYNITPGEDDWWEGRITEVDNLE